MTIRPYYGKVVSFYILTSKSISPKWECVFWFNKTNLCLTSILFNIRG